MTLKIAILGTGKVARQSYLPYLSRRGDVCPDRGVGARTCASRQPESPRHIMACFQAVRTAGTVIFDSKNQGPLPLSAERPVHPADIAAVGS